jgi:cyclopropane fatty-acyl-phospholipid synthase-like methyltransferase
MAATAGHRLTLDPMGKYSNAFFSETTNMIHPRNIPAKFGSNRPSGFGEEA